MSVFSHQRCVLLLPLLPFLLISPHSSLSLSFSNQYPTCLLWWPLRLGQRCWWACCFPACVPAAPQRAHWPGAANKLCIQTVDATNEAVQWTSSGDEQLKRCWILLAREGARPLALCWSYDWAWVEFNTAQENILYVCTYIIVSFSVIAHTCTGILLWNKYK